MTPEEDGDVVQLSEKIAEFIKDVVFVIRHTWPQTPPKARMSLKLDMISFVIGITNLVLALTGVISDPVFWAVLAFQWVLIGIGWVLWNQYRKEVKAKLKKEEEPPW